MSALFVCLSHISWGLMEICRTKWQESDSSRRRKKGLQRDSDSNMELCLLFIVSLIYVCQVFVQENIFMSELFVFLWKRSGKCLFTKLSTFSTWLLFCHCDNSTKTNLRMYIINMQCIITIHSQTNTQCFSECDYPVCLQTSLGSLRPALLQHSGTVAQKGLITVCRSFWPRK